MKPKKIALSDLLTIRDMAEMSGFAGYQFTGYIATRKIKPAHKDFSKYHYGVGYFTQKQYTEIVAVLRTRVQEEKPIVPPAALLPTSEDRYIKVGQVAEICGISKRAVFRYLAKGYFVKPFILGDGAYRWSLNDIHNWVKTQR